MEQTGIPPQDIFTNRHLGPNSDEVKEMLNRLGCSSLEEFSDKVVPAKIRSSKKFTLTHFARALSEHDAVARLKAIAAKNQVLRSLIGMGYYASIVPPVIQRNIFENPGWYTQYTPYQPEISQGRLEALLNFQTLITDLTGLAIANASLLDEGTAAAEAMNICYSQWAKSQDSTHQASACFAVSKGCHPQTIALIKTRAAALGIKVQVADDQEIQFNSDLCGLLIQYPDTEGKISDPTSLIANAHAVGALAVVATDLLALTLLKTPAALGADIAIGNAQRLGVPLGFGGPHAAFMATRDEFKRLLPGRLVGVSKDANGTPAMRLALQTREQHIRREKATSNICTAQVLLAIMSGMYAVYHGPLGLTRIAQRIHVLTCSLAEGLKKAGLQVVHGSFFDTLLVEFQSEKAAQIIELAKRQGINLRLINSKQLGLSLDELSSESEVQTLLELLSSKKSEIANQINSQIPSGLSRESSFLTHPVFNRYHSETEFLRYLKRLESKDLSLAVAMIPLGSCTMKLNATSEMLPVTWPEFSSMHPFAPEEQTGGYRQMFGELEDSLAEITGFAKVSLQPNAGSQGEYAGLLAIRAYHESRKQPDRKICLIPKSAHGTNPASAAMAGMEVIVVECDAQGNVDISDLKAKAVEHAANLAALMVTYPSTHGVFEEGIAQICEIIHSHGGQVYMDGANLNALVGLARPCELGADVCHINLHKTFCIPHGGGGPGMGPIGVAAHLAGFLPTHPLVNLGIQLESGLAPVGPVSSAPWGSASILPIPWVYMAAMGADGLRRATQIAILNANYLASRLSEHFPVLYRGASGMVAHECILDLRDLKRTSGVEVEDVAKRLMDYGFHAPTVSFPVPGTLMVEPTESESKAELDRFCDAMISIRVEIRQIEEGKWDRVDNPLKNAPHTALAVTASEWNHSYSREVAAYPSENLRSYKFWPAVARIDSSYGDRNLFCSCIPL